jgi:hypothetical protein
MRKSAYTDCGNANNQHISGILEYRQLAIPLTTLATVDVIFSHVQEREREREMAHLSQ